MIYYQKEHLVSPGKSMSTGACPELRAGEVGKAPRKGGAST